jgi:hypothetical protein
MLERTHIYHLQQKKHRKLSFVEKKSFFSEILLKNLLEILIFGHLKKNEGFLGCNFFEGHFLFVFCLFSSYSHKITPEKHMRA